MIPVKETHIAIMWKPRLSTLPMQCWLKTIILYYLIRNRITKKTIFCAISMFINLMLSTRLSLCVKIKLTAVIIC